MITGVVPVPIPDAPTIPWGLVGASLLITLVIFLFWKNTFGRVLLTIGLTIFMTLVAGKAFL